MGGLADRGGRFLYLWQQTPRRAPLLPFDGGGVRDRSDRQRDPPRQRADPQRLLVDRNVGADHPGRHRRKLHPLGRDEYHRREIGRDRGAHPLQRRLFVQRSGKERPLLRRPQLPRHQRLPVRKRLPLCRRRQGGRLHDLGGGVRREYQHLYPAHRRDARRVRRSPRQNVARFPRRLP